MEEIAYVVKEKQGEFGKTLLVIYGPFARVYHWGKATAYSWICFEYVLGNVDKALKRYRGLSKGRKAKRNPEDFVSQLPPMEAFESGFQDDGSILYREDGAGSGKEIFTLDPLTANSGLAYCDWASKPSDWNYWKGESA